MYFVYILYSEIINKYYIGCTEDLDRRLDEHNRGLSSFTSKGTPWKRVYWEEFKTLGEARRREIEVKKKKSRKYIEYLIKSSGS
ncbi:GIY-YIG nuclease family protein [Runella zeae]|uniref:GIY-YIG nuclease family protein n=1 Tax=Runella zeae TaxID=94255 RepID=UPI00048A8354|nr:GIY-YIG nuclease family protein [Runella zeae]